ncbi:MAG: hypothetical protein SVV80_06510 [Planctomycetota bacterium]|nr:hypothetical protein [Planctomycetota bacterium]
MPGHCILSGSYTLQKTLKVRQVAVGVYVPVQFQRFEKKVIDGHSVPAEAEKRKETLGIEAQTNLFPQNAANLPLGLFSEEIQAKVVGLVKYSLKCADHAICLGANAGKAFTKNIDNIPDWADAKLVEIYELFVQRRHG